MIWLKVSSDLRTDIVKVKRGKKVSKPEIRKV